VSPVRYQLGVYIPEDGIFHSHCRETSNITCTTQHFYSGLRGEVAIYIKGNNIIYIYIYIYVNILVS
jgi:hypothetical protein